MPPFRHALLAAILAATASYAAAPPTAPADPARFVLQGDLLMWCEQTAHHPDPPPYDVSWHCAAVRGAGGTRSAQLDHQTQHSVQYHVAFDSLWLVSRSGQFSSEYDASEYIHRYPLKELDRKAGEKKIYGWWPSADDPPLQEETAGNSVRWRTRFDDEKLFITYTDFAVTGPLSVRQFVLLARRAEDDEDAPWEWSLKAYSATFASSEEPTEKIQGAWKHDETLPVAFREPFTLLTRGDDYYFVTRSGKVFLSPKPPKDKKREMKCIWSDKSRKVVGLVTDAKTGRSFLFCRAPEGERPDYFELDPKPRPVPYGAKAVEYPDYEPMIATGRKYARALIADGKVKLLGKPGDKK